MADNVYKAAMPGVPFNLQDTVSATGGGTPVCPLHTMRQHQVLIKSGAGVASGAVQIECTEDPSYAGTWAPIGGGPITVPAASTELAYNFDGIYKAIRGRISTIIGGGTIDVIYTGTTI